MEVLGAISEDSRDAEQLVETLVAKLSRTVWSFIISVPFAGNVTYYVFSSKKPTESDISIWMDENVGAEEFELISIDKVK